MHRTTRLIPTLALLLTTLTACDGELGEPLDAELEAIDELELEYSADDAGTPISSTEIDDVTLAPAAGPCGEGQAGHWEFDTREQECGSCDVYGLDGKHREHYTRWCWDGGPSCGGCGGWQYTGWSCAAYVCN